MSDCKRCNVGDDSLHTCGADPSGVRCKCGSRNARPVEIGFRFDGDGWFQKIYLCFWCAMEVVPKVLRRMKAPALELTRADGEWKDAP